MGIGALWDQLTYLWAKVKVVRGLHFPAAFLQTPLSPARVQRWPSAGPRRGQYAGSALLRNEAVHTVFMGHVP